MLISVVVPVFNSSQSLNELYFRLASVLDDTGAKWEIIMVDDGSEDQSFSVMERIHASDNRVKIIRLSEHAGQHNSTLCGLKYSRGDYVVTIDDDLQNPPEEIPLLLERIKYGFDVVFGIPREKHHKALRNWGSRFIDKSINLIFPAAGAIKRSSFRILTRELVDRMLIHPRPPVYMAALILTHALKPGNIEVRHETRKYGQSNYNIIKTFGMTRNLLINYSYLPLKFAALLWVVLIVFTLIWVQTTLVYSNSPVALGLAIFILLAGVMLTIFSFWLAWQYWLRQRRDNNSARPPYLIREIEL